MSDKVRCLACEAVMPYECGPAYTPFCPECGHLWATDHGEAWEIATERRRVAAVRPALGWRLTAPEARALARARARGRKSAGRLPRRRGSVRFTSTDQLDMWAPRHVQGHGGCVLELGDRVRIIMPALGVGVLREIEGPIGRDCMGVVVELDDAVPSHCCAHQLAPE